MEQDSKAFVVYEVAADLRAGTKLVIHKNRVVMVQHPDEPKASRALFPRFFKFVKSLANKEIPESEDW